MKECVTHHYACDCREEAFKRLIEAIDATVKNSGVMNDDAWSKILQVAKYFAREKEWKR